MRKIVNDNKGFTLTEVMIGIMILTVAIVSSFLLINVQIKGHNGNPGNSMESFALHARPLAQDFGQKIKKMILGGMNQAGLVQCY